MTLTAAILAFSFLTAALGALAIMAPAADTAVAARLRSLRRHDHALVLDDELTLPFAQRILVPIWQSLLARLAALLPRRMQERAQRLLDQAGVRMDPARYVGLQATLAAGGLLLGLLLNLPQLVAGKPGPPLLLGGILALAAWRLPNIGLLRRMARRKAALRRALPDVLDLLTVSVEAGLGFDGAVQKVAEKFPEPVAGEFREFLKEVRLGRPRPEALRALADRSGVPDLQTFAAAVIQADQLGVSIAKVLKGQSESMRIKRRQRAEEQAMQLPLKLLFPVLLFIFPTLFIVVLGPVAISLMQFFTRMR